VEIDIQRSDGDVGLLFAEESSKIWRSVLLHTGQLDVARDATAEAFAQLLRQGSRVRDPRAWVWRAAFRIADRELARRSRDLVPEPADPYEMPEQVVDLVRALRRLPRTQREAVVLHHLADRSVAEIATILGTSRSAVAVHLHRGRRRLRELLEDHDA
jgi:RNA polymerase sigma-70 factor (ECF subfamily)